MSSDKKYKVLYLCDYAHPCVALIDHIYILKKYSVNDIYHFNPIGVKSFDLDLKFFDVVIVHYSVLIISDYFLPPIVRAAISKFQGLKIQLIQDEYRWVNQIASMMFELGINTVLTLVKDEDVNKAWGQPEIQNVEKIAILTGYMPKNLMQMKVVPICNRKFDLTYRSREIPFWLGRLAQDKELICTGVQKLAPQYGLNVNLSVQENARIYGKNWIRFMQAGKAALGTESGSSIFDFTGEIQKSVNSFLVDNQNADFEKVFDEILKPYEGNLIYTNISPRLLEAISLRTGMVIFKGCYRGMVEPWRHYIPLEKDFSNFSEVVDCLNEPGYLQDMVNLTFNEVGMNPKYAEENLAELIDKNINKNCSVKFRPHIQSSEFTDKKILYKIKKEKIKEIFFGYCNQYKLVLVFYRLCKIHSPFIRGSFSNMKGLMRTICAHAFYFWAAFVKSFFYLISNFGKNIFSSTKVHALQQVALFRDYLKEIKGILQ